ncbi:DUF5330 domain-containing protein [Ancylobacter oerskovii]|uniref:DUF5330 domain-containing protein n=1 Tax=Ancylobacter oerskovii TaxID=459519 RepID=A0ABW4YXA1_9HYPH|nr:DUF5330 domain-containing protein [Ancylobacter oerskovii]MBS7542034.1 DUF5330 domain-containing protein [Ancylobacter oerskovii]
MFFLLRIAFWLTVVLLLLPAIPGTRLSETPSPGLQASNAQPSEHAASGGQIDPLRALSAATSAVSDAGSFCERQPQACAIGSEILTQLGTRAQAGAQLLLGYIGDQIAEQKRKAAERAAANPSGDTLTAHDLSPAWQAPGDTGPRADSSSTIFGPPAAVQGGASPAAATPAVPTPPRRPS